MDRGSRLRNRFIDLNLLSRLTALENVALPLSYSGIPRRDRAPRAKEVLERVGLDSKLYRPSELSGGEQQRVAIARALVNDPEIICADEPTGNLDTQTGKEIIKILLELNMKGVTIILVTHDREIASYAERIIKL